MAAPDDDLSDLDDLLSTLDPVDPLAPAKKPGDARPSTEMLDADMVSEKLPAIRTPLPPQPPKELPLPGPVLGVSAPPAPPKPPPTFSSDEPPAASSAEAPPAFDDQQPPAAFTSDVPLPAFLSGGPPPTISDTEEAEPPLTLDPLEQLEPIEELPPVSSLSPEMPAAADPEAAFALAEAEANSVSADVRAAASEAARAAAKLKRASDSFSAEPPAVSPPVKSASGSALALEKRGLPTIVWVAIISFAVAGLGAILYTQIDAFHPERQKTRDQLAEGEKDRFLEAHRRAQPVPGTVTINAGETDAAVWLLLGRTPLESITLPSNQVHEVRFELQGRSTVDTTIDRTHWTTEGSPKATLSVTLPKGSSSSPAFPAEKAVKPPPGPAGRGELLLESTPAGARAWLLIGFTPEVKLSGIESGRRYEFRVAKDGFLPSYAVVEESDWSSGRTEAARSVTLAPAKTARK